MFLARLFRTGREIYPSSRPGNWRRRSKYLLRGALLAPWTSTWLQFISRPVFAPAVAARPRLYAKIQRPYLSSRFAVPARVRLLVDHYRWLEHSVAASVMAQLYRAPGVFLGRLELATDLCLSAWLRYCDRYEKEGDLQITLECSPGDRMLYTISASVLNLSDGRLGLFVGGLQGGRHEHQPELVRRVTHAMHGLRPKACALFTMQQLAQWLGAAEIRAVGDHRTVYRHFQTRQSICASYDALWLEAGGVMEPQDGYFLLPVVPHQRTRDEIKPQKRRLYEKRYALLEEFAARMRVELVRLRSNPESVTTAPFVTGSAVPVIAGI